MTFYTVKRGLGAHLDTQLLLWLQAISFTISPYIVFWLSSAFAFVLLLVLLFVHPENNQKYVQEYKYSGKAIDDEGNYSVVA